MPESHTCVFILYGGVITPHTVIHCHALLLSRRIFIRGPCCVQRRPIARDAPPKGGMRARDARCCTLFSLAAVISCAALTLWLAKRKEGEVGRNEKQPRQLYGNPAVALRLFLSLLLILLLLRLYCHYSYYYDYSSYYRYH